MLLPGMSAVVGSLLLIGEWICVEVAWRCIEYSTWIVTTGVSLIIAAVVMAWVISVSQY